MKNAKRILAFVIIMVMLAATLSFGAAPLIVSPAQNSIVYNDTLLVSVKLTEKQSVKITVFEEMDLIPTASAVKTSSTAVSKQSTESATKLTTETAAKVSTESAAKTSTESAVKVVTEVSIKLSGSSIFTTAPAVDYKSVDVKDYTKEDLVLINAGETKDKDGKFILLSNGDKIISHTDVVFADTVTYKNTNDVGYYTKQLTGFKPGLYKVQVEVLGVDGKVKSTTYNLVAVKEKEAEETEDPLATQKTGIIKVISDAVKNLIK